MESAGTSVCFMGGQLIFALKKAFLVLCIFTQKNRLSLGGFKLKVIIKRRGKRFVILEILHTARE